MILGKSVNDSARTLVEIKLSHYPLYPPLA